MTTIMSCPDKPNCVSSTAHPGSHFIEPLQYEGDDHAALDRLRAVLKGLPRTKLVDDEGYFLRYEVRTRFLRFVDDVEFCLDPGRRLIDVRSASRVGYSDMGVNRKRVEEIRARFDAIK